jgi:hypothetical protein
MYWSEQHPVQMLCSDTQPELLCLARQIWRTFKTWSASKHDLTMIYALSHRYLCQTKWGLWKGEERRAGGGRRTFGQSHLLFHFSEERGVKWKDEAAARRVLRTGRVLIIIHWAAACMVYVPAAARSESRTRSRFT